VKKQPIYKYMPSWVHKIINKDICTKCHNKFNKKNIIACGLREASTENQFFYVEVKCTNCSTRTVIPFHKQSKINDLKSLSFMFLDRVKKYNQMINSQVPKPNRNSSITNKEVDDFIKMLNKSKSHIDFMKNIGIKDNEICNNNKKYKKNIKKESKKNKR